MFGAYCHVLLVSVVNSKMVSSAQGLKDSRLPALDIPEQVREYRRAQLTCRENHSHLGERFI